MPEQQRKHLRLPVESTTFIELVSPRLDNSDSGKILMCNTLNVSRSGLLVGVEQEVTVGAILQIGVDLPNDEDTLYLAGEVRWCRPNTDSQESWLVGFRLMNAGNSDIDRWIALLTSMEG